MLWQTPTHAKSRVLQCLRLPGGGLSVKAAILAVFRSVTPGWRRPDRALILETREFRLGKRRRIRLTCTAVQPTWRAMSVPGTESAINSTAHECRSSPAGALGDSASAQRRCVRSATKAMGRERLAMSFLSN